MVMVRVAVTGFASTMLALTDGHVVSFMLAGGVHWRATEPVKPPTGVMVTDAIPDCPGAEIVTVAMGEMLNGAITTFT